MRKLSILLLALALLSSGVMAQNDRDGDVIRCYTVENEAIRHANDPSIKSMEEFEQWLAPLVRSYELNANAQRAVSTIPIVFHVIHNNGSDNLSASFINSQIEQLNYDFRRVAGTSGFNNDPAGADTEIEFCAATIDPNGNSMAEPGINRVNRSSAGFNAPPYSRNYYESTIKPNTIWDPNQYLNVWVSGLSGGLLGYAQFPEASSLPGIGTGNGGANTDGVVVVYTSVGSSTNPHPNGGVYAGGRTLTHEIGHWLGLRHIWGDGGCNVDDFCDDTPRASSSTNGCPNKNTCNDISYGASSDLNDMVENYMDYSYDNCMNIFTNDQKARMQTVLASSVRRASLLSSGTCGGGGSTDTQAPTTPTNLSVSAITTTTATLSWNASSDNVGVTGYDVALNGNVLGTVTGTTANITGLSSATTYSATVTARDAAGNVSGGANTSFTTLSDGGNCVGGSLTLTINLDNYPEETSWTVTSGGSTVASGGTYGSQPDGSTVVENITLDDGSYTFTINDAYGDGICCGYGNGSYSLTSGSTVIVSGGSFGSSESTNFCVEGGGPAPDTEAPTTPTNVTAFNIGETTADVSWNASTDNVGVTEYNVYLDGSLIGSTSGTSAALTGLVESTTYTVSVRALDAAGNISGSGSDGFTTLTPPDTQAPTTPGNVTAFNVAETTADVSWNASSDNVGVTGYNIYLDGSLIGNTSGTSTSLSGLTANTSYTVSVRAEDAAGNLSGTGSDNFTTTGGGGGPTTDLLFGHYFESGWDVWADGGSDCARYRGSRSYEGSYSIRLRDNSGVRSRMTLNNINVTGYDQLDLQFYFYPSSMENGEDFFVAVNDGSGFQSVGNYASGTDFNNNTFYVVNITLNSNDFNFNSGFDIAIQCDASANADRIYIDQISLTGIVNGRYVPETSSTIKNLGSLNAKGEEAESAPNELLALDDFGVSVYPNPAKDIVHIASSDEDALVRVYSVTGVMVAEQQVSTDARITLDIANWQAGTYIVTVQSGDEIMHEKFIKY